MAEEWEATDSVIEDQHVARGYIIEKMPVVDDKHFGYVAFRQDGKSWETKWERAVGGADSIKALVHYMDMHFPGSRCIGYIPAGIGDEES